MENDREHLDSIEQALSELREAERAGVFRPTRVHAKDLTQVQVPGRAIRIRLISRRLLAVAAVLMVALTAWTFMFQREFAKLRDQRNTLITSGTVDESGSATFADCMSGPSVSLVSADCLEHDRNGDGAVDLRDFSNLQLASARALP